MAQNETFFMAGPAGRLEAILMHPEGDPGAAAVICHAHPLHGGIMHFKVLFRAAKALQEHGVAVLRFNFRGVGGSEGVHDEGRGEKDDARTAVDEMARRFPARPIVLGGFSFGSNIALRVGCADARVTAILAMGYPIAMIPEPTFLAACVKPRLFVHGSHDNFGPEDAIRRLVDALPEPRRLAVIPQSDHFFTGHLDLVQQTVAEWAATRPWEAP